MIALSTFVGCGRVGFELRDGSVNGATVDGATVPQSPAMRLGPAWYHNCFIDGASAMWCWGLNDAGQLGQGNTTGGGPYPVGTDRPWSEVKGGNEHSCALAIDGSLWCWGNNVGLSPVQLGAGPFHQLSMRIDNACVLAADSTPYCVSVGSAMSQIAPDAWSEVAAGNGFECGRSGEMRIWCMGSNNFGQCGVPGPTSYTTLVEVVAAGVVWTGPLRAGDNHVCTGASDGNVWCWGLNSYGQLGDPNSPNQANAPVVLGAIDMLGDVTPGSEQSCSIHADATLWCWGQNTFGQLGVGDMVDRQNMPTQVGVDTDWANVIATKFTTCALKRDDSLWCWGTNVQGQVDQTGPNTIIPSPRHVVGF
jgi:alpha-tubulin suppressor-like RCC1 family protein